MQLNNGGKTMCQRLLREICDRIYEYVWQPTPTRMEDIQDRAPDSLEEPDLTYPELVQLSTESAPAEVNNILARSIPIRLEEAYPQMAAELVQWLYENVDLGLTCFNSEGVYFRTPGMPRTTREVSTPPTDFPTLEVCNLIDVLETDLFGVGISPSDCKLRALSVLVNYKPAHGNRGLWARSIPFKQTLTYEAMDTLLEALSIQPKTDNFRFQLFVLAWRMEHGHSHNLLELATKVHAVSARARLLGDSVEVTAVYCEYLLDFNMRFNLVRANGSEGLPQAAALGEEEVEEDDDDPEPRFLTWEEWDRERSSIAAHRRHRETDDTL